MTEIVKDRKDQTELTEKTERPPLNLRVLMKNFHTSSIYRQVLQHNEQDTSL